MRNVSYSFHPCNYQSCHLLGVQVSKKRGRICVLEEKTSLISKLSEIKYYMYAKIPERSILAVKIINKSGHFTQRMSLFCGFFPFPLVHFGFLCIKNEAVKSQAHAKHRYPLSYRKHIFLNANFVLFVAHVVFLHLSTSLCNAYAIMFKWFWTL